MGIKAVREEADYDAVKLPVSDIIVNWELNGRSEKPTEAELKELVESIEQYGQLQPVLVRHTEAGYELVAGFGRVEAIRTINERVSHAPVLVKATVVKSSDEEAFVYNVQENLIRRTTSPIDDARNIDILKTKFKKSVKEIAQLLGKTDVWVRKTAKLATLDKKTQSLLHKGEMGWAAGTMLVEVEDPKERKKIVKDLDAKAQKEFEAAKARIEKERQAKVEAKATAPTESEAPVVSEPAPEKVEKIPVKKISTKDVAKRVRESGVKDAIVAPNKSTMREFFICLSGPAEASKTRDLAKLLLDYADGRVSDQLAEKKFRAITQE